MDTIQVEVKFDYDGYFQRLVKSWIRKKKTYNHEKVTITATPYLGVAVMYEIEDKTIHLTFYSALRAGFGSLSKDDIDAIIELL